MRLDTLIHIPSVYRAIIPYHHDINISRATCKVLVIPVRHAGRPLGRPYNTSLYSLYTLFTGLPVFSILAILTIRSVFARLTFLCPYIVFGSVHLTRQAVSAIIESKPVAGIVCPAP